MEQMNLFDFLPDEIEMPEEETETSSKWLSDEQAQRLRGDIIPFRSLEDFIGQKVIEELGGRHRRVIIIKRYLKDIDEVYDYSDENKPKLLGMGDRIAASDDLKRGKENMQCSEADNLDGRYPPRSFPERFYELRGQV